MDLDDELRRLFQDDRLEIQVRPGADQAMVTGARRVRRRRVALASVGGAFAAAALVGIGVALAGIGMPKTMEPADQVGSSVTTTVTAPPSATAVWPVGYGPLKLAMSESDALATGVVTRVQGNRADGCRSYSSQGNPDNPTAVLVSPNKGVSRVTLPGFAKTSTGLGAGSTVADLKARYPSTIVFADGYKVRTASEQAWYYVFVVDQSETIVSIRMELENTDCALLD